MFQELIFGYLGIVNYFTSLFLACLSIFFFDYLIIPLSIYHLISMYVFIMWTMIPREIIGYTSNVSE